MALVSFRLFCKNLGNLQEFFGKWITAPPLGKIARTPMARDERTATEIRQVLLFCPLGKNSQKS